MAGKFPFGPHRETDRSISELFSDLRNPPPKEPSEAASYFIYALAHKLLERETHPARRTQILEDFREAARDLVDMAANGATAAEQHEILANHWMHFELPETDLRKRQPRRGPSDAKLRREVDVLRKKLAPILRDRKKKPPKKLERELGELVSWATPKAVRDAASEPPTAAAWILIGDRYQLEPETVRNRISQTSKRA